MAEASPVPSTPSRYLPAPRGQPVDFNTAGVPGGAPSMAGTPETGPASPPALMGRTRAQTTQIREGGNGAETAAGTSNSISEQRSPTSVTTPASERATRTSRIRKTNATPNTTVTVATSKDFEKLFWMLAGLDLKVQAIGQMLERELAPATREQYLPPPPSQTGI